MNNAARITEAIGYDVEVSEPNGPAVRGYITARWADERQPDFDRWLAARDKQVAAKALIDSAAEFAARLPDGTGNGRAYNSHTVARMLNARAAALGGGDHG